MPQTLPTNPNLDWLRKAAKKRFTALRSTKPDTKLHEAQLSIANDYGFKSWRALKTHVETVNPRLAERDAVFDAARGGDIEALPEGAFKASGTMVNTLIATIPGGA